MTTSRLVSILPNCLAAGAGASTPHVAERPPRVSSTRHLSAGILLLLGCSPPEATTGPAGGSRGEMTAGTVDTEPTATVGTEGTPESPDSSGQSTEDATNGNGMSTGGELGTAGPDTGGGVCHELQSPACLACRGRRGPQRLFGLTWNFAGGASGSSVPGSEELRCIVPETGETELIAMLPGMDWLLVGGNAHDRGASIVYAFAYADADQVMRLFSIDTVTGAILGKPPVTTAFNFAGGLHVRDDGTLIALAWNPIEGNEELHVLDPVSGENTLVAAIPAIDTLLYAVNTYHGGTDTVYMLGAAKDDPTIRLFAVDAESGELLSSPALAGPDDWSSLHTRADGQLLGLVWTGQAGQSLVTIEPETAEVQIVAEVPALATVLLDVNVYDPVEDVVYLVAGNYHLLKIDAHTGDLLGNAELDVPGPDSEYNWSGGLHVR